MDAVGQFVWRGSREARDLRIIIAIPYGLTRWVCSEWTIDHKNECGAQWSFSGSYDCPTLSPSLHAIGVWHGWVRDGKLVEA